MEIIFFYFLFLHTFSANLLSNSGFENPTIGSTARLQFNSIDSWDGSFQMIGVDFWHLKLSNSSQYIDLQSDLGNGYISQVVTLPENGTYQLSFVTRAWNTNSPSYVMQVIVNGQLKYTYTTVDLLPVTDNISINAVAGNNNITLRQIGISDGIGTLLDDVFLELVSISPSSDPNPEPQPQPDTNKEENKTQQKIKEYQQCQSWNCWDGWQIILSFPLNQLKGIKFFVILLDDVWLYYYDKRKYQGVMLVIFETINQLERLKWQYLNIIIPMQLLFEKLPLSDYIPYSRESIVTVNQTDQTLIRNIFYLLLFNIPQNIFICLVFYLIFRLLSKYQISKWFRRYYFSYSALFQITIEGNLAYLIFLGFHQFQIMFSFNFCDKCFLVASVLVIFICIIFMTVFYYLTGAMLEKCAAYFIYCFYRVNQAYYFLTIKMLYRAFLRAATHFFLYNHYGVQIALLCFIQLCVLLHTVYIESKYQIFLNKTFYCLFLLYHGCMIALNISLYIEFVVFQKDWTQQLEETILSIQLTIVYCLIMVSILMVIVDLLPGQWLKNNGSSQMKDRVNIQDDSQIESKTNNSLDKQKIQKINEYQGFKQMTDYDLDKSPKRISKYKNKFGQNLQKQIKSVKFRQDAQKYNQDDVNHTISAQIIGPSKYLQTKYEGQYQYQSNLKQFTNINYIQAYTRSGFL